MYMSTEEGYVREKLGSIESKIESIEKKVDEIGIRLEGYSSRLRKVENWKTGVVAIAAFLGSVITLAARFITDSLFRE